MAPVGIVLDMSRNILPGDFEFEFAKIELTILSQFYVIKVKSRFSFLKFNKSKNNKQFVSNEFE